MPKHNTKRANILNVYGWKSYVCIITTNKIISIKWYINKYVRISKKKR